MCYSEVCYLASNYFGIYQRSFCYYFMKAGISESVILIVTCIMAQTEHSLSWQICTLKRMWALMLLGPLNVN